MPILRINGHDVDVDILAELERYDWGYNARWSTDKLIAASPFRDDNTPSFYVNLTGDYAGVFGDSGAYDDGYKSGGFVKLLAYLRGEGEQETADYLLDEYGALYEITPNEPIRLPTIAIRQSERYKAPDGQLLTQAVSPYLRMRNISKEVQRTYGVGYGANYVGFTALPWYTPDGRLANVKYRSTRGKSFFYEKGATPIRTLIYGLNVINSQKEGTAVLCEGEIDVLSWATAGIPAIACGGSSISNEQIDAIKRSSIRKLLVGGDNDPAGQRLNMEVIRRLGGYIEMYTVEYEDCSDANEYLKKHGVDGLHQLSTFSMSKLRVNCLHLCNITVT